MAILKLSSQIVDDDTKVYLAWNGMNSVSYGDVKDFIASIPEDDDAIEMRIDCAGGDVVSGWAMYDALRQSGKNISAVIEGQCSSMATCILLAAPLENRKAYPHAHLCIHNPEACYLSADYYERLTADNLDAMADKIKSQAASLRAEQQKILDLYVERTGSDAESLQALMNEDIYINMARAKELGFINETLVPNTACKNNSNYKHLMNMSKNEIKVEESLFNRLLAKCGFKSREDVKFDDLKVTAADGSVFEVEREDGQPQVGDAASPDGNYVMEDGSTIVVEDGVITAINPAEEETVEEEAVALTNPANGESLDKEQAQQLLVDMAARIAELEEKLKEQESAKDEADAQKAETEEKYNALVASMPTEEQKEILAIVDKAGGKAWLDKVGDMQSNGAPKTPNKQEDAPQRIGASFLASQKRPFRVSK